MQDQCDADFWVDTMGVLLHWASILQCQNPDPSSSRTMTTVPPATGKEQIYSSTSICEACPVRFTHTAMVTSRSMTEFTERNKAASDAAYGILRILA